MPATRQPVVRSIWWAQFDKVRLCVVLRCEADRCEVIYGQGKPDPQGFDVAVEMGSEASKRFRITKDTYFRGSNVRSLTLEQFESLVGTCSQTMLIDIEDMLDRYAARMTRSAEVQDSPHSEAPRPTS